MTESRGFGTFDGTKPLICRHPYITVFAEENGPLRMWACSDCNIRFYPACEICVTIGHRSEIHEPHDRYDDAARIMLNQADEIATLRAELEEAVPKAFGVPKDGKWYEIRGWVRWPPYNISDTSVFAAEREHGYTCGWCDWGRIDQPRSKIDYDRHVQETGHVGEKR